MSPCLARADHLHDGVELLDAVVLLLLLQHEHEVVPEARLRAGSVTSSYYRTFVALSDH